MNKGVKKPQLRFKGFDDEWKEFILEDIYERIRNAFVGTASPYYVNEGNFYLESNNIKDGQINRKNEIFINDVFYQKQKDLWLRTGDIVMVQSGHVGHAAVIPPELDNTAAHALIMFSKPKKNIEPSFLNYQYLTLKFKKDISNITIGNTIKHILASEMKKFNVVLTSKSEQEKIGEFFNGLDNLITAQEKKCEKLKNIKKAMLEKMFPQNNSKIPQLRFKGFDDEWEECELKDLCTIITKQTGFDYSATIKPSLVMSPKDNTYPFIQNKDFSDTNINLKTDFHIPIKIAENFHKILLDRASILISISGKIGNVGAYLLDQKAFVGGAVGICKLINKNNALVILYSLESNSGQKYFQSLIKASSHSNITVEDIRKIPIKMPKTEVEKIKIGNYFQNLEKYITAQEKKCEKLKNIKKAMLEKMFV